MHFINDGLTMEMPGEVPDDNSFAGMMHTYFRTRPENSGPPTKPNLAALAGMLGGTIPEESKGEGWICRHSRAIRIRRPCGMRCKTVRSRN